ncbi:MAG: hypothetical protein ACE5HI_02250 [bacterium]
MTQIDNKIKVKMKTNSDEKIGSRMVLWLRERYDISALEQFIMKKQVPIHRHSLWYYFGGITLFFFFIQVATGIIDPQRKQLSKVCNLS